MNARDDPQACHAIVLAKLTRTMDEAASINPDASSSIAVRDRAGHRIGPDPRRAPGAVAA